VLFQRTDSLFAHSGMKRVIDDLSPRQVFFLSFGSAAPRPRPNEIKHVAEKQHFAAFHRTWYDFDAQSISHRVPPAPLLVWVVFRAANRRSSRF
jgi:hypothetical protein